MAKDRDKEEEAHKAKVCSQVEEAEATDNSKCKEEAEEEEEVVLDNQVFKTEYSKSNGHS